MQSPEFMYEKQLRVVLVKKESCEQRHANPDEFLNKDRRGKGIVEANNQTCIHT